MNRSILYGVVHFAVAPVPVVYALLVWLASWDDGQVHQSAIEIFSDPAFLINYGVAYYLLILPAFIATYVVNGWVCKGRSICMVTAAVIVSILAFSIAWLQFEIALVNAVLLSSVLLATLILLAVIRKKLA